MLVLLVIASLSSDGDTASVLAKIQAAATEVEQARAAYNAKLQVVQKRLTADLNKQLEAATKRGDFELATSIKKDLERLEKEDFGSLMEDLLGSSALLSSTKKKWVGVWAVKIGPTFEGSWDVKEDGTVNGGDGTWKLDLLASRIRLDWKNGGVDHVKLPLVNNEVRRVTLQGLMIVGRKVK